MWLVATTLDKTDTEHFIITERFTGYFSNKAKTKTEKIKERHQKIIYLNIL